MRTPALDGFLHRLRSTRAYTLVELLCVIVIVALLLSVALPTIEHQSDKVYNSATQQSLMGAYQQARAVYTDAGQILPQLDEFNRQLVESAPGYGFRPAETGAPSTWDRDITVTRDGDQTFSLCAKSRSGLYYCLRSDGEGKLHASTAPSPAVAGGSVLGGSAQAADNSVLSRCVGYSEPDTRACLATRDGDAAASYVASVGWSNDVSAYSAQTPTTTTPTTTTPTETTPTTTTPAPPPPAPVTYEAAVSADGPGAQCGFDESGNGWTPIVCPSLGYGQYDGQPPVWQLQRPPIPGATGTSVRFNGATHWSFITSTKTSSEFSMFSVEIWARFDGGTGFRNAISAQNNWALQASTTAFVFRMQTESPWATATVTSTGITPANGVWYHMVGEYDNGTMRLFVNGAEVGSKSGVARGSHNQGNLYPGGLNWGDSGTGVGTYLQGGLDNFAFYRSALPAARVAAHYHAGCAC